MKTCKHCGEPVRRCPARDDCTQGGWLHNDPASMRYGSHVCDAERELVAEPEVPR